MRRRWPLKFIHFLDDIFNIDDEWMEDFCRRFPHEVCLPFDVILRTNLTTREHMQMLRAAGCISARLAFEAASDDVRNKVYRKGTTLADLRNSARYVKERTEQDWEQYARALRKFFGTLRLNEIHAGHLHEYQRALAVNDGHTKRRLRSE